MGKTQAKTTPGHTTAPTRTRELAWVFLALVSVLVFIAVATHDPSDTTWWRPSTLEQPPPIHNAIGWFGADIAVSFWLVFGVASWFLPMLGVWVAVLSLAKRPLGAWLRWLWGALALICVLMAVSLSVSPPEDASIPWLSPAGAVGDLCAGAISSVVGVLGAWLVVLGLFAAAAGVLLQFSWGQLAERAIHAVEASWPGIQHNARAAGGTLGSWSVAIAQASGRLLFRFLLWTGHATRSLVRSLWTGLRDFAGGAAETLRGDPEAMAPGTWSAPGSSAGSEGSEDDPDATHVGQGTVATGDLAAQSVVMAWDPTQAGDLDALLSLFPEPELRTPRGGDALDAPSVVPSVADPTDPTRVQPASTVEAPTPPRPQPLPKPFDLDPEDPDSDASEAPFDPQPPEPIAETHKPKVEAAEGLRTPVQQDNGGAVLNRGTPYYELPPLSLLRAVPEQRAEYDEAELAKLASALETSLAAFKLTGQVQNIRVGPVVTTFEFLPDLGIRVNSIASRTDDLAMALCARAVRVLAPIPGKGVVGIEVPNSARMTIYFRELLASPEFRKPGRVLPVALGKDVEGLPIVSDLAKMPHLLIGGTTGSGKSVGVNGLLLSLLFTRTPDELKLLLIDPKQLEFASYADIPHLLHPVVTEPEEAAVVLAWAVDEMERRYSILARWDTRSIANFNKKLEGERKSWTREKARHYAPGDWPDDLAPPPPPEPLPYLVIVIDELADLMMVARKDVETSIVRLAQKARACGIHLVVATQRPSVDVVTGLIKSNMPTRISFQLRSMIDSRTVLDEGGAEKLLGRGDMLLLPNDGGSLKRVHGAFVDDDEVVAVVDFIRAQRGPDYVEAIGRAAMAARLGEASVGDEGDSGDLDPLFDEAVAYVREIGEASTSRLQRRFQVGYNRAARMIDQMFERGIVGPPNGSKPRKVLEESDLH